MPCISQVPKSDPGAGSINGVTAGNGTDLGLNVSYGNALWILWGAVLALLLSIIPLCALASFNFAETC